MAKYPTVSYPVGRSVNLNIGTGMHDTSAIANANGFTADSLVARAGGGRPTATPVRTAIVLLATVATAGDSVMLPPAVGGQLLWIANGGAASAQLFADLNTSDTINGAAAATGIALAAGKSMTLFSATPGAWFGVLSA